MIRLARFTFSFLFLLSAAPLLWADTVHGRVTAPGKTAIAVVVYDEQGKPYPQTLTLKVDEQTQLNGVASTEALQKGDAVKIEVSRMPTGLWRADRLEPLTQA